MKTQTTCRIDRPTVPCGAYGVDPEALRKARAEAPRGQYHAA